MYAETGLMLPYFQSFPQQIDDFSCSSQRPSVLLDNLIQASSIAEYDLGVEGDLFKAPAPIIEEPIVGLDPMEAAMSMISCGGDVITSQDLKVSDIDPSIDNGQLLSEVFYECKKDILAKEATEATLSAVLDIKVPQGNLIAEGDSLSQGPVQKSVSSGCLTSMEWVHSATTRPNFLDFPGFDLGAVYGMRRAFSEGDIKSLGNGSINVINSPVGQPQIVTSCSSEARKEKLSRYRNKKNKRNFGRKIKYACRKALADSQPRIRGRFAKTDETDSSKKQ
ncbi:OLC1v1027815C1 [Oldenlandia corymbosa var. corymbosa]|uniref:OLC1v1027815C1 n=1 Tax=Oldenlandia corymbosa var. corymbosa TaxID=529605 RepID=A0AAV1CD11_OLDCO|nr:OLC1v1027815C1 [Oldenlandia corymbosa var. corymbosa]